MIMIETDGTWHDIGKQYAEQAGNRLHEALNHYAGWLKADISKYTPEIEKFRRQAATYCPDLLEETAGMAEAAKLDETLMFGFRFFGDMGPWSAAPDKACSCIFIADAEGGPLLGRNSDLEPGNKVSTTHFCRPESGTATISTAYLGMAGIGAGMNEHGLGITGASAAASGNPSKPGLSAGILSRMLLGQCGSVGEAIELLKQNTFQGRSRNWIIADASGDAALIEFVPGTVPATTLIKENQTWLACTNFFISSNIPNLHDTPEQVRDLDSAYARYGRIVHQLHEQIAPHTLPGMKQLLIDTAQPGMCQQETNVLRTAYTTIFELKDMVAHISEGHPAETPFITTELS